MKVLARLALLAVIVPLVVAASPGQYWLDVCHDVGHDDIGRVDEIVHDNTSYEVTCSADPWVQGYGGRGEVAWVYVEVVARDADGNEVARFDQAPVRPTGAVLTSDRFWAEAHYQVTFVEVLGECTVDPQGVCNPSVAVPVIVPEGVSVDPSARQTVRMYRDGYTSTLSIDLCALPGEPICSPAPGEPGGGGQPDSPRGQRVYLHCAGADSTTRLDNLNGSETTSGTVIGWDTSAPTGELPDSGCAYADPGRLDGQPGDLHLSGTYTGRLDEITIETYVACLDPYCRGMTEIPIDLSLTIDGRPWVTPRNQGGTLAVRPEILDGGHARIRFTIGGIGLINEDDDVEHTVEVSLATYFQDSADLWLYDAADAPAGLWFHPGEPTD